MEKCFWKKFQTRPHLPCIVTSLMTSKTELKRPQCENLTGEMEFLYQLHRAQEKDAPNMRPEDCNCPKRCNQIDYHISADPTQACQLTFGDPLSGEAVLFFSFPSQKVCNHSSSGIIFYKATGITYSTHSKKSCLKLQLSFSSITT